LTKNFYQESLMGINVALNDTVFERLRTIVGSEHVLTDDASCVLYSQDVFTKDTPALAVVLPENTQQLADSVRTATESGYEVIPRGGGMSYTSGYVPVTKTSLIVDLGRMNKIIEINRQDMYVTLECGCTWKELYDALKDTGLRTPYWGTLSGKKSHHWWWAFTKLHLLGFRRIWLSGRFSDWTRSGARRRFNRQNRLSRAAKWYPIFSAFRSRFNRIIYLRRWHTRL
jgi:hypothetical protein